MTVVNRLATLAFGLIATDCVSPAPTNGDHMSAARACATWAAGMRAPRITCWLDAPAVVAVLFCVVFGQLGGTAHASACADEIAQLSERSASLQPQAGAALSAPQSIGAHLGHQPTPESVQRGRGRGVVESRHPARACRSPRCGRQAGGVHGDGRQCKADSRAELKLHRCGIDGAMRSLLQRSVSRSGQRDVKRGTARHIRGGPNASPMRFNDRTADR